MHLHVQLRANLVGLTLRILAKDCRVKEWVKGQHDGSLKIDENHVSLVKKILRAHGVQNPDALFLPGVVNKENVKALTKSLRKWILEGEFYRMKQKF